MKNKAGLTVYSEEIYFPCEFRVRVGKLIMPQREEKYHFMPTILTGWVQDEIHLQWGHQSLQ